MKLDDLATQLPDGTPFITAHAIVESFTPELRDWLRRSNCWQPDLIRDGYVFVGYGDQGSKPMKYVTLNFDDDGYWDFGPMINQLTVDGGDNPIGFKLKR